MLGSSQVVNTLGTWGVIAGAFVAFAGVLGVAWKIPPMRWLLRKFGLAFGVIWKSVVSDPVGSWLSNQVIAVVSPTTDQISAAVQETQAILAEHTEAETKGLQGVMARLAPLSSLPERHAALSDTVEAYIIKDDAAHQELRELILAQNVNAAEVKADLAIHDQKANP